MNEENTQNKMRVLPKRKPLRMVIKGVLYILGFFVLCSFLLQIPGVQNWTVDQIASRFSKNLNTKVSIDHVNLNIFKGFVLNGFYLEDLHGDTLLYTEKLSTSFSKNLLSLLNKELNLNKLTLENGKFQLKTKAGELTSNLNQLFKKEGGDETKKGSKFLLDVRSIDLKNVEFILRNEPKAKEEQYKIQKGSIVFDHVDLEKGVIDIQYLFLEKPIIAINKLGNEVTFADSLQQKEVEQVVESGGKDSTKIRLQKFVIKEGQVSIEDMTKEERFVGKDIIDFNHLKIMDLDLDIENLHYIGSPELSADIKNLSFDTRKGFKLESLKSDNCIVNSRKIELPELVLKTENSIINDKLVFKYRDFEDLNDFAEKVIIQAALTNSNLAINDIIPFAEDLNNHPFFIKNKNRKIHVTGELRGRIANLNGRNIQIRIPGKIAFAGSFDTRNLNKQGEELVNLKLDYLDTNMKSVKDIIPGFNPPENFYKLGQIHFEGRFDGYFKDFVAFGFISSAVGTANLDMRLDVNDGRDLAKYSGNLSLSEFDLGGWSGNSDLGRVSFVSKVSDGKGLSLESASAKLDANIESFVFKNYNYQNLILDGVLNKNLFDGKIFIEDENIDLNFAGNITMEDSIPVFDFNADIKKIDLHKLNITKDSIQLSGGFDINLKGNDINTIVGTANLNGMEILLNKKSHKLDFVEIISSAFPGGDKRIDINSEVLNANIEGSFDLAKLDDAFMFSLRKNYPELYRALGFTQEIESITDQNFKLDLLIKNTNNLLEFAGLEGLNLNQTVLIAKLNSKENEIDIKLESPFIAFKENNFNGASFDFTSKNSKGELALNLDSANLSGTQLNPILIQAILDTDNMDFLIATDEFADTIERIRLAGNLMSSADNYILKFKDSEVQMLGTIWNFDPLNQVLWKNRNIEVSNFSLSDGKRLITLDNIGRKGLNMNLKNFNTSLLNDFISYDKLNYDGLLDLNISTSDIFARKDIGVEAEIPSLFINGDDFGQLKLKAGTKDFAIPVKYELTLNKNDQKIYAGGNYNMEESYLEGALITENFPLAIIEYWVASGISGTKGDVMMNATYSGKIPDIKIDGKARLYNGGIGIDYLGTYYTFHDQPFTMTDKKFDLTGAVLEDGYGNTAVIEGYIYHNLFGDFGANARAVSDQFVALNTTKDDNPLYYGFAQGELTVDFNGSFDALDISVTAETGPKTFLKIPVGTTQDDTDESFIKIIDQDEYFGQKLTETEGLKLGGISFDMNLSITPDAQTSIIFNERKGDIIKGTGRGNIRMEATREGEFNVYGDYEIVAGNYLFTAWSIVNKPFTVRRGGTIKWTGDPFNALINIEADYEGVRTSLSTFLAEYLGGSASESVKRDARKKTDVDLVLKLQGRLYNPTINFDLNFPDISGELKSLTDSKMRVLRANENALNDQVFGLMVFQTFLPTNNPLGNEIFTTENLWYSGVNTISEFVSSQLSMLISGMLQEGIAENTFISGIDFEIGFTHNSFLNQDQDNDLVPDEVDVHIRNRFLDDRWSIIVGGNFVRESESNLYGSYLAGDFVLEYFLTEDRKLKIKAYGIYDFDEVESQRRQKYGLGISFRTEFSTLKRFKEGVTEAAKDLKDASSQVNE